MKKVSYKSLAAALMINFLNTLVPACFQRLQSFDAENAELALGFSFDFYTIKYAADKQFAIHFNIVGFAANIVVVYMVIMFIGWVKREIGKNSDMMN